MAAISAKEMKNRKRIWDCNRELVEILLEEPVADFHSAERPACRSEDRLPELGHWRSVGGEFTPLAARQTSFYNSDQSPCKSIWEQTVPVPTDVKHIAVSLRTFCGREYVCGLRFISRQSDDVIVGYVFREKEVHLNPTDLFLEDGGELNGFITAVGPAGIHAIRATNTRGRISNWAGRPDDLPLALRLCMKERIQTLRACFDVRSSA
jgi:U3 small nucleolar RNA-associated protein 4